MLKPEDIPSRVIETAKTVYTAEIYKGQATAKEYHDAMLAAITAALNAWPGVDVRGVYYPWIVLPLPQYKEEGN